MQTITINCFSLTDVDNALQSSWSGDNVIAFYQSKEYRLLEDTDKKPNCAHLRLINDSHTNDVYGVSTDGSFYNHK